MEIPAHHYRVLPVDDEINVLNALRRELTTLPHKFIVYTFASPRKVLQAAQKML
jgi:hypothetical protein